MKKVLLIMAAALLMMTQCRKPETPSANTIKMTITVGPGAKTNITDNGAITWTSSDKLYVSNGTKWLGSLDLYSGAGSATGKFTGEISEISDGTTCHFFYLGHDNGMTAPTANTTTNAVISFASQDGSREGALKYHLGHGEAVVTVSEGVATGAVRKMRTEIAIAHLNFTTDGTSAYTGSVTMDVSNTMTVRPDGTFIGSGNGITIGNNGGTSGDRYVTLIPTEETNVSFSGCATGSMTFGHGIQANNLYGMTNGIKVTVEAAKFSVGENTTVEFAPGNLYWDGSAFHFEANQWDFRNYNGLTKDAAFINNGEIRTTPSGTVGSFFWSKDAAKACAEVYDNTGVENTDVFFTNATETTANTDFHVNGETGENKWRTLSNGEWDYLLKSRTNASSLSAWKDLGNGVKGLVILPDGTAASVMERISSTADLASSGAVFLPAAGDRDHEGNAVWNVGSYGSYWSSTCIDINNAYYMFFNESSPSPRSSGRNHGYSVRLVR